MNELSIFRVAGSPTLKMHTSLNIKLLRGAPHVSLFTSYTQNHKHGMSRFIQARIRHTSYKHGMSHFTASQPAAVHSHTRRLPNRPKIRRHHLPQYHIHTGHHKLCRPLCILTRKNQFASKKRLSHLSA